MVGLEAEYIPYEFYKDGKIVGYDPDIIERFVDKLGVKAQLVDTAWNGIIPALYASKFDVIISGMTITRERSEKVLFSMPYADASTVILIRASEDQIKTAEDLSGKILGVGLGSAAFDEDAHAARHEDEGESPAYPPTTTARWSRALLRLSD